MTPEERARIALQILPDDGYESLRMPLECRIVIAIRDAVAEAVKPARKGLEEVVDLAMRSRSGEHIDARQYEYAARDAYLELGGKL